MEMSLRKKQITALNSLVKHMENYPLAKELNYKLNDLNLTTIANFFNDLNTDDFLQLQEDKRLKITNPILNKMLSSKLVDNRDEYLKNKVVYDIGFDLDNVTNRDLSYFLRHEAKGFIFCSKNEALLNSLFQYPASFYREYLNDFESGATVHFGKYSFNKNAFSPEFNEAFVDYMKNYEIYMNHPRVGKDKLLEVAKDIIQKEVPSCATTMLIDFKNLSIEFDGFKKK
jgi:hypothetical protein